MIFSYTRRFYLDPEDKVKWSRWKRRRKRLRQQLLKYDLGISAISALPENLLELTRTSDLPSPIRPTEKPRVSKG